MSWVLAFPDDPKFHAGAFASNRSEAKEGGHGHWVGLEVRISLTVPPGMKKEAFPGTSAIWATALPEWLLNDPGLCLTHSQPSCPLSPDPGLQEPPALPCRTHCEAQTGRLQQRPVCPELLIQIDSCCFSAKPGCSSRHFIPSECQRRAHHSIFHLSPHTPQIILVFTQPAVSPDLPLA